MYRTTLAAPSVLRSLTLDTSSTIAIREERDNLYNGVRPFMRRYSADSRLIYLILGSTKCLYIVSSPLAQGPISHEGYLEDLSTLTKMSCRSLIQVLTNVDLARTARLYHVH